MRLIRHRRWFPRYNRATSNTGESAAKTKSIWRSGAITEYRNRKSGPGLQRIQLDGTSMSGEAEIWRTAPVELTHPWDRVDVWKVWLDSAELSSQALPGILAPDEVERARRFHFDRDRIRFTACRTALRTILA